MKDAVRYDIVIPTIGRPSLDALLARLGSEPLPANTRVVLADDRRPSPDRPALAPHVPTSLTARTTIVRVNGRGPAAARNAGWNASAAPWVVFLDDDVVPGDGWGAAIAQDLERATATTGAVQGRVVVPRPADRRPNDRERNVGRLATAEWISADLAVRREVLVALGGFDERFPRAYREDTDFQLRTHAAGFSFARGGRTTLHPPGRAPWWSSIAAQRGNADDALLRAVHGPEVLDRGRRPRHQLTMLAAMTAGLLALARHWRAALVAATAWLMGTSEFALARIRPGPRHGWEIATMLVTSVAIPPAATFHWWRGRWRWRQLDRSRRGASGQLRPATRSGLPSPRVGKWCTR